LQFKLLQLGLKQPLVPVDIILMCAQTGNSFSHDEISPRKCLFQNDGELNGRNLRVLAGPMQVSRNARRSAVSGACGRMIAAGQSWGSIQAATGCSRDTIAKIAKRAA
jgi:hypothetical protein